MSDRVFKRIPVNIEAEIVSYNVSYPAFIRNISERGIHAKIADIDPVKISKAETCVDLKLQLPSGETINLNCRKRWSYKNTSNSFIENIGIEIIDPPQEYRSFCQTMSLGPSAGC